MEDGKMVWLDKDVKKTFEKLLPPERKHIVKYLGKRADQIQQDVSIEMIIKELDALSKKIDLLEDRIKKQEG